MLDHPYLAKGTLADGAVEVEVVEGDLAVEVNGFREAASHITVEE